MVIIKIVAALVLLFAIVVLEAGAAWVIDVAIRRTFESLRAFLRRS
jgi:hypothetical protein